MGAGVPAELSLFAIVLAAPFLLGFYSLFKAKKNLFVRIISGLGMTLGVLWILLWAVVFLGMVFG